MKYDLKKYFTDDGIKALKKKLESSLRFYNEEEKNPVKYPIKHTMFGFPEWIVDSKEELRGRIMELTQMLNIGLTEEKTVTKDSNEESRIINKIKLEEKDGS